MNAELTLSLGCRPRWPASRIHWHRLLACLIGVLVAQSTMAARTIAAEGADDGQQITASLPEAGAPPAPTSATAPASATAIETESAAASEVQRAAEEASSPSPVEVAEPPSGFTRGEVPSAPRVRELSVPPEAKPLLPADRPAWVGAAPELSGSNHRLFVGSFPTSSPGEADAALDEPLLAAVNGYIDETVLDDGAAAELDISPEFIRHNLIDPATDYMAELSTSQGSLYQKWVVVRITPEHRQHFVELHRQLTQRKRLVGLGLGILGLLGLTGAGNLVFNRRRRRYADAPLPGTFVIMHEEPPPAEVAAAKRRHSGTWLLALGGIGMFFLVGILFTGMYTVRSVRSEAQPAIRNMNTYPPSPPSPPSPADVHVIEMPHSGPIHGRETEIWIDSQRVDSRSHRFE